MVATGRIPIAYLAPWVDLGGTAKGTVDWFRWLDRERFAPSLITTQHPSRNRLLAEVASYAEEVWVLPEIIPGREMPDFILDFLHSRGVAVVHVMNSRLGFELLPDMCCLPRRPAIVVQLHVEEDTRRGYVSYVATRYGNLVDAFSVTSRHLRDALVDDYDVPASKCRVIYTGVDAEEEFSPAGVTPEPGLDPDVFHLLFLGRLVEQKDPLLMVEVARRLALLRRDFRVHVVGYGALEADVRAAVRAGGLSEIVRLHGPTTRPAGWLAAADALLITSVYEGIPYTVFEAMAMEVPVIAPLLPGTQELMLDRAGILVEPRDDVDGYVAALSRLMDEPQLRRELGREARERVRREFSVATMARRHEDLYDELLTAAWASDPAEAGV